MSQHDPAFWQNDKTHSPVGAPDDFDNPLTGLCKVRAPGMAQLLSPWHQWGDQDPFRIMQVTCIFQITASILRMSYFSLQANMISSGCCKPVNRHRLKSLNSFSARLQAIFSMIFFNNG
ncbi:hypothetical protein [Komagataeibacter diospyri]|uniref:hypothetical protein n=1 Tax=Komagataeibacter diospyri TaxID=1932662 RepID=UPI0011427027|nr:hypothetical protein [Komagataeibacter diospyri]